MRYPGKERLVSSRNPSVVEGVRGFLSPCFLPFTCKTSSTQLSILISSFLSHSGKDTTRETAKLQELTDIDWLHNRQESKGAFPDESPPVHHWLKKSPLLLPSVWRIRCLLSSSSQLRPLLLSSPLQANKSLLTSSSPIPPFITTI